MDARSLESLFRQAVDLARLREPVKPEDGWVSGDYRSTLARIDCGFSVSFRAKSASSDGSRFEVDCMVLMIEEDAFMGHGFAKRQWSAGDPPIAGELKHQALVATAREAKKDTNFKARRQAAALARQLDEHCSPGAPGRPRRI